MNNLSRLTDKPVRPADYRLSTTGFRRGFTLVELLVCMLLVMLVSVGISQVFALTRTTVATGQKVAEMTRDARAATSIMQQDGQRWATDAPLFIIRSSVENVPDVTGQVRLMRRDTMSFPMRGKFHRATGDAGSFINPETSGEAWVWYGHCNRVYKTSPPNTPSLDAPPQSLPVPTNVLGRVCMLLVDPTTLSANAEYFKQSPSPTWLSDPDVPLSPLCFRNALSLASYGTVSTNYNEGSYPLNSSRYDLMGSSLNGIKSSVQNNFNRINSGADPTMVDNPWHGLNPLSLPTYGDWWNVLTEQPTWDGGSVAARFFCSESVVRAFDVPGSPPAHVVQPDVPPTSNGYSRTTPVFLRNAPELVIEFAGDYLRQNDDGSIVTWDATDANGATYKTTGPDGVLDFAVVSTTGPIQHQVRWYGLARSTRGAANVNLSQNVAYWTDVVPLATVLRAVAVGAQGYPYFERRDTDTNANGPAVWVWVNEAPKMVRVLFKQDDPEGLIRDGPWTEFIMGPQ